MSDAVQSITSTMKAFGIAAEDSMMIVDKFNEVGVKSPKLHSNMLLSR